MMLFQPLVLTLQQDSDVYACTVNHEVIRSRNVETGYNSILTTKVRNQTKLNLLKVVSFLKVDWSERLSTIFIIFLAVSFVIRIIHAASCCIPNPPYFNHASCAMHVTYMLIRYALKSLPALCNCGSASLTYLEDRYTLWAT